MVLEDCNLLRVEFHDCRMSAFQTPECRFENVGFLNCKLDGANFRMSTWKRSHFDGCDLAEADSYGVDVSPSDHRAPIGASLSRFQKHDRFGSLRFEIVR